MYKTKRVWFKVVMALVTGVMITACAPELPNTVGEALERKYIVGSSGYGEELGYLYLKNGKYRYEPVKDPEASPDIVDSLLFVPFFRKQANVLGFRFS